MSCTRGTVCTVSPMTRSDGQKTLHHLMKSCTISDLSRHSKREGTKRSGHHCAFLSMIFPETSIYFADTSLILLRWFPSWHRYRIGSGCAELPRLGSLPCFTSSKKSPLATKGAPGPQLVLESYTNRYDFILLKKHLNPFPLLLNPPNNKN